MIHSQARDSCRNYLKNFMEEEKILQCLEAGPEKDLFDAFKLKS